MMIKKILNVLYSTKTMAIAFLIFAVSMAVATFIENDFGTNTAKSLVYNAKWFEFIMLVLVINFLGNITKYRLYEYKKWPVLLFHLAFIVIVFGAFITRYYGYEGIMPIREGKTSSIIYSDNNYIVTTVDNNRVQKSYENEVLFNNVGLNKFELKDKFGESADKKIPFEVSLVDFIPNAMESLKIDSAGTVIIHLVESSSGIRKDVFLEDGGIKSIKNILFTFNNPIEEGMNSSNASGELTLQAAFDGKLMEMLSQKIIPVYKDSIDPVHLAQLYSFDDDLKFVIVEVEKAFVVKESAPNSEKQMHPYDALVLKIESGEKEKLIELRGTTGSVPQEERTTLNGLNFNLSYGSKIYQTPYEVELRDFELEKYPGTNSASSYASEVTILDGDNSFDYRIYMNHVLDYKGFRFFQASYDNDEAGTVLSVNHDFWGTLITYIGYFLMGLGMFIALFWNGTRFNKLSKKLKALTKSALFILLLVFSTSIIAQSPNAPDLVSNTVSREHAALFGRLLIQDHQGRIKPVNTYAIETLRKIYKKDYYEGLTADQVILSAMVKPQFWANQRIIRVRQYALGAKMCEDLKVEDGLSEIVNYFSGGHYYLENKVADAFQKSNIDRNATDKEIINLDERVNVWWSVLRGNLMNIYPKLGDSNNKWYTGIDKKAFVDQDSLVLKMHQIYIESLQNAMITKDYTQANNYLELINQMQINIASEIMPSVEKVDLEIRYNNWNIFKFLMFFFMIVGFAYVILAFIALFNPDSRTVKFLLGLMSVLTIIGLIAHFIGMGVRWFISGHEPWSNGYEAIVFVAFITICAGIFYSLKKSKFAVASTVLFASFLLAIAHGSAMNPEITNLVPVLKSYWLMVHVAIITASYGFLGLSSLLGAIVLLLYIIRNPQNAKRINHTIKELTFINESSMIVGLYALSLGTFLGGVWASESWGRYWSWDPKEVWSLISMVVYIFILHLRLVPHMQSKFIFNLFSMFSISTLIMTFFGVNYYLSGMHSYAAGDPVPIPLWVYYAIVFFIVFAFISYWKYSKYKESEN